MASIPSQGIHAVGSFARFLESSKYSDVTIRIQGEDIPAHKIVLAKGSEYFEKLFSGQWSESNAFTVELRDDEPLAIKGLIAYLYGTTFDHCYHFEKATNSMRCDANETQLAQYHVDLYIVAMKYLVPERASRSERMFWSILAGVVKGATQGAADKIAEHVYVTRESEAIGLRHKVTRVFVDNITILRATPKFRSLLLDVPELASDMVFALADNTATLQKEHEALWKSTPGSKPIPAVRVLHSRAS